jgi:hypothetical protein
MGTGLPKEASTGGAPNGLLTIAASRPPNVETLSVIKFGDCVGANPVV